MLRYADLRLDASTLKELPDGSIKVVGQLTHPGIFDYRNPDGSRRREYRPKDEVLSQAALESFAGTTITVDHPRSPNGQRLVTPSTWKNVAIGHVGDNVRADGDNMVADLYIRDASAIARVRSGDLKHISCGYNVEFDATPGTTPGGDRYDGVQRNIRGNHVALLPNGIAPRGGSECVLRLDSNGDELKSDVELQEALDRITVLEGELKQARTDAAEAQAAVAKVNEGIKPERLDALVAERAAVTSFAKANGVELKDAKGAAKSSLQLKREVVAKRTPALAARVDSMSEEAIDGCMAVYAEQPHPSMDVLGARADSETAKPADKQPEARADGVPTYTAMFDKHLQASRDAWKNSGDKPQVRN